MKTKIKSNRKSNLILITFFIGLILVISCKKEKVINPVIDKVTTPLILTKGSTQILDAESQIREMILNINDNYSQNFKATGFTLRNKINNETDRLNIVRSIISDDAYAPFGNAMYPNSVGVKKIKGFNYDANIFNNHINSIIEIGNIIYSVEWYNLRDNTTFKSICVFNEHNRFIWDNIFSLTLIGSNIIPDTPVASLIGCKDKNFKYDLKSSWVFPGTPKQGESGVEVILDCICCDCDDSECVKFDQSRNTSGFANLGKHKEEIKFLDSPAPNKCIKFAWAVSISTFLTDVKFSFNVGLGEFEISTSGLGTNCSKTGEDLLCCEGDCPIIDPSSVNIRSVNSVSEPTGP